MRFTIPEILKAVNDAKTHEKKVSILQNCGTEPLEQILQYNFHPDIAFNLPEGECPYKKEKDIPVGKSHSNLYKESRRLYLFLKGQAPNLKPYRREMLFIELLEGIHWTEAEVLVAIKDKNLQALYPGVTYEAARDAFARLLPQTPPAPKKVEKPVKLAIPDIESALAQAGIGEEVGELPLVQPVTSTQTKADSASDQPKEKKPVSEAQLAGIRKAQEARRANAAAKRAAAQGQ